MRRLFHPVITVTLALLASLGIGAFAPSLLPTIPKAHAANVSIVLTGCASAGGACTSSGWNGTTPIPNPTITVTQGDKVSLTLTSADGAPHQFLLDVDGDGASDVADCPKVDPCSSTFTATASYAFNATMLPGTYTYFCFVHPIEMRGSFKVNPSSTVGGVTSPLDKGGLFTPYIGPVVAILVTLAMTLLYLHRRKPSWRTGQEKSITSTKVTSYYAGMVRHPYPLVTRDLSSSRTGRARQGSL